MAAFGTPIHKPTNLWASGEWILDLVRPLPPNFVKTVNVTSKKIKQNGKVAVTGKKQELKESQGYTDIFGRAVMKAFVMAKEPSSNIDLDDCDCDSDIDLNDCDADAWADANPVGVLALLGRRSMRAPW